jgi:hypothetical protein
MNPIRIAIMTIATVSATTFAYSVFAPSTSKLVSAPVQTQISVLSASTTSDQATALSAPVVAKVAQTPPEIQYVDVAVPSQNAGQEPRENEDRNGENNDSE